MHVRNHANKAALEYKTEQYRFQSRDRINGSEREDLQKVAKSAKEWGSHGGALPRAAGRNSGSAEVEGQGRQ